MQKPRFEPNGVTAPAIPMKGLSSSRIAPQNVANGVPVKPASKGVEIFPNAIADAIADRLEHRQNAQRRVLDMDETVEYLGASEDTIYRLIAEGKLTPVRFDRRIRFDIRDLNKLIEDSKRND